MDAVPETETGTPSPDVVQAPAEAGEGGGQRRVSEESYHHLPALLVPLAPGKEGGASVLSGTLNLTNTSLGAGMLATPYAFAQLGLISGMLMLVFFGLLAVLGLHLHTRCGLRIDNLTNTKDVLSYGTISSRVNKYCDRVVDFAVLLKCFGVLISYLIIMSDLFAAVSASLWKGAPDFFVDYRFWQGLVTVVCLIPLCCLKKLDSLRFVSVGALVSVAYLVGLIVYFYFFGKLSYERGDISLFLVTTKVPAVLPVFVFAFTCHQNIYSVYGEMTFDRFKRSNIAVSVSVATSASIYFLLASFGYLTTGANTNSNIIQSYPLDDIPVVIGRIFIGLLVTFSYPLLLHPARACADALLFKGMGVDWWPRTRFFSETAFLVAVSFVCALFMRQLGFVLSLVGSSGGTLICFILPGWFYWTLHPTPRWHPMRLVALALLVFGIAMAAVCLTFLFLTQFGVL
eukprot:TRINITY_DN11325_c0_g1_i1.p1 TRINITY_DN11325_c0_g1~~TRINITY_DN11325_c0_g1_i1.p1  ORF type:complete len:493 (+),score=116.02 TRINITY_DN11325_c0_g1_i1:110-1480(+)